MIQWKVGEVFSWLNFYPSTNSNVGGEMIPNLTSVRFETGFCNQKLDPLGDSKSTMNLIVFWEKTIVLVGGF